MELQEKIKRIRKEREMSQQELAELADINISYLSRLENGHSEPSVEVLKKLMNALEVSADYLLSEDVEEQEVRIQDKSLAERIRLIDTLDEDDRKALIQVIDSMLTKQKMKQLINQSG